MCVDVCGCAIEYLAYINVSCIDVVRAIAISFIQHNPGVIICDSEKEREVSRRYVGRWGGGGELELNM